jgi:uncharacterized membrane protein (DUF2068 family)
MNNNHNILEHRPTGVTIITALFVLVGAVTLLGGIATLIAIPFVANISPNAIDNELQLNGESLTPSQQTALVQSSGPILTALGTILIPLGIASLIVAYGLFKGKRWAWSVAVILSAIGFAINVVSLVTGGISAITSALVGIVINAIVLYYLYRRNVRQYFGKMASAAPPASAGA